MKQKYSKKAIRANFRRNKWLYIMIIPVLAYYIIFAYIPMAGIQIAFKDFNFGLGIWGSPWVGFKHFISFFTGPYAWRVIRNTLIISALTILICFPAPILFALLLNEVRTGWLKKGVQTLSYLPHFISLVVICGLIKEFTASDGLVSVLLSYVGVPAETMLTDPTRFRAIYVVSELWQTIGWDSIIYLAALAGVDMELMDAAAVDGCGRFQRIWHITIPSLIPTVIIMFIMRIGQFMSVGSDKILLLYNSSIYETADIIATFVYRKGLIESNFSYAAAVGVINSVVNFTLVVIVNQISSKVSETSLW